MPINSLYSKKSRKETEINQRNAHYYFKIITKD